MMRGKAYRTNQNSTTTRIEVNQRANRKAAATVATIAEAEEAEAQPLTCTARGLLTSTSKRKDTDRCQEQLPRNTDPKTAYIAADMIQTITPLPQSTYQQLF